MDTIGMLGVVFVTLKLIGILEWSWLWVTAPFWMPFALIVGIIAFTAVMAVIIVIVQIIVAAVCAALAPR